MTMQAAQIVPVYRVNFVPNGQLTCHFVTSHKLHALCDMLLSCGSNSFSHLALGHSQDVSTFTPTLVTPHGRLLDLVSVSAHTLILVDDGTRNTLYGIGTNTVGQLGTPCALRDEEDKQVLNGWRRLELIRELQTDLAEVEWQPVKIGATWTTSFVIYRRLTSGKSSDQSSNAEEIVVACGSNDFNELGYTDVSSVRGASTTTPSSRPRIVDVGLQPGDTIDHFSCGQRHIMLVISSVEGKQRVVGWGAGRRGEFDLSTLDGSSFSGSGASSKGKGKAPARPTTYPPTELSIPLDLDERIIDISLGASHTLALTSKHRVLAWGSDQKGQIRGSSGLRNIKQISASWGGSYFITNQGQILSQGSNIYSQLLHDQKERAEVEIPEGWCAEKIIAGSEHLSVLLTRGEECELWVGGWNEHGNLGLGDRRDRARLSRINPGPGKIEGVWGGCASTWLLIRR